MDVDFPVFNGLPYISHVEGIGHGAMVCGEAALDFVAFFGGEEFCSLED
jgi:hypothetical protein